VDAAEALAGALVSGPGALPADLRQDLVRQIAAGQLDTGDAYDTRREALAAFGLKLARHPHAIGPADVEALRPLASEAEILEVILAAAAAVLRRTLDAARGTPVAWSPDAEPSPESEPAARSGKPYLTAPAFKPGEFPPFDLLRNRLGFVPALYKAQTLSPRALEAQIVALREIVLEDGAFPRRLKELVVLAVSAASLNTYCVTVHGEILRTLGVPPEESDVIAENHRASSLSEEEKALLDEAISLVTCSETQRPSRVGSELAAVAALTAFLNTLERGLSPRLDFRPRRDLVAEWMEAKRTRAATAIAAAQAGPDPDAAAVAEARGGQVTAFEQLLHRHQAAVYRTIAGITGNAEDAEDGTQIVFVKVFRKIGEFSGDSRFSTWLTRIAINEGLEILRRRKPTERLAADGDELEFRPVNMAPWVDDPERLYARNEMRQIVQEALAGLPDRYRIAVFLRDIEQLSTVEAAAALGIPVAALKTRLLRGRLMMREALAPFFDAARKDGRPV
jgi:RNA polymerase sigma-70 factor (ECF subfamily)